MKKRGREALSPEARRASGYTHIRVSVALRDALLAYELAGRPRTRKGHSLDDKLAFLLLALKLSPETIDFTEPKK